VSRPSRSRRRLLGLRTGKQYRTSAQGCIDVDISLTRNRSINDLTIPLIKTGTLSLKHEDAVGEDIAELRDVNRERGRVRGADHRVKLLVCNTYDHAYQARTR